MVGLGKRVESPHPNDAAALVAVAVAAGRTATAPPPPGLGKVPPLSDAAPVQQGRKEVEHVVQELGAIAGQQVQGEEQEADELEEEAEEEEEDEEQDEEQEADEEDDEVDDDDEEAEQEDEHEPATQVDHNNGVSHHLEDTLQTEAPDEDDDDNAVPDDQRERSASGHLHPFPADSPQISQQPDLPHHLSEKPINHQLSPSLHPVVSRDPAHLNQPHVETSHAPLDPQLHHQQEITHTHGRGHANDINIENSLDSDHDIKPSRDKDPTQIQNNNNDHNEEHHDEHDEEHEDDHDEPAPTACKGATEVLPGCKVQCLWRGDQWRLSEILERRKKPGTEIYEYYVHYDTFNRRLDEWVQLARLDLKTLKQKVRTREERDRARKRDGKRKRTVVPGDEKKEEKTNEEKAHEEATKVKNVQTIIMGKWAIDSWYYSPFPREFTGYSTIRVCDFCLDFFRSKEAHRRHSDRCLLHQPPGQEIYRKDKIAMFEVDGIEHKRYCQNLCYIAKLYLDHKTLFYDTDPFFFYILCEIEPDGYHMVGYFSKEKASEENYNVACILTMPPVQRKGYGKFLIAFSYELSKIEGRAGSPEKPLSDLGLLGYRSYWSQVLVDLLRDEEHSQLSIQEMSTITMMKTEDIISTLQVLNLIQYAEGQHIIDLRKVQNMKLGSRGFPVDPSKIKWTPKATADAPGSKVTLHL